MSPKRCSLFSAVSCFESTRELHKIQHAVETHFGDLLILPLYPVGGCIHHWSCELPLGVNSTHDGTPSRFINAHNHVLAEALLWDWTLLDVLAPQAGFQLHGKN